MTVSGSVTTDGVGDYTGALTITGSEWTLWHLLSEGAFVQQVDAGADGWTVDDTVWGLLMTQAAELPATTDSTKPDTKPDMKPGTDTPATGDNSHMALWIALLFIAEQA